MQIDVSPEDKQMSNNHRKSCIPLVIKEYKPK